MNSKENLFLTFACVLGSSQLSALSWFRSQVHVTLWVYLNEWFTKKNHQKGFLKHRLPDPNYRGFVLFCVFSWIGDDKFTFLKKFTSPQMILMFLLQESHSDEPLHCLQIFWLQLVKRKLITLLGDISHYSSIDLR